MSDFDMRFVEPKNDVVVVLDRINDVPEPGYCTHGKSRCLHCDFWVWLGEQSFEVVSSGNARPLCLVCAKTLLDPTMKPLTSLYDHRREEWTFRPTH